MVARTLAEHRAVKYALRWPGLTSQEIREALGAPDPTGTVAQALKRAVKHGILRRDDGSGFGRKHRYFPAVAP